MKQIIIFRNSPPRKFQAKNWIAGLFILALFALPRAISAQELEPPLCIGTAPDCPEVRSIPQVPGRQTVCSYDHLFGGGEIVGTTDTREIKKGLFKIYGYEHKTTKESVEPAWKTNYFKYYDNHRIQYGIVCDNGIEYAGEYEWSAYSHRCTRYVNHNCSHPEDVWEEYDVGNYGSDKFASEWTFNGERLEYPGTILDQWAGRKVGTVEYFGGTNKLAVPVILIAGLGFDYTVWGVEAAGEVGSEEWLAGRVLNYHPGSLPDLLSSSYNLSKGADINENGIFFINIDPSTDLTSAHTQSIVQNRLTEIFTQYLDFPAHIPTNFQVDIVCHSTACLAVRELIEQMNTVPPDPIFGIHPVNHIRKILTVNAPHLGTGLGKPAAELGNHSEYTGLPGLMGQVEQENTETVMDFTIELDYSEFYWDLCTEQNHDIVCVFGGILGWTIPQLIDTGSEIAQFLGFNGVNTFSFSIHGGLFGPHYLDFLNIKVSDDLTGIREVMANMRTRAQHEHQNWFTPTRLLQDFPKRPDGSYIELFPFYSEHANDIEIELVQRIAGKSFDQLCIGNSDPGCYDLQRLAKSKLHKEVKNFFTDNSVDHTSVTFKPWLDELLSELRTGWLANSDALVERGSQTWGITLPPQDEDGNPITQIHIPQTYTNHYADYPEGHAGRPVLHAPLAKTLVPQAASIPQDLRFAQNGATLMGMDLFCALDPACATLTQAGRNPIYMGPAIQTLMPIPLEHLLTHSPLWTQVVDLLNDFTVTPIVSGANVGIAIQNEAGENQFVVGYSPQEGTYVWQATDAGAIHTVLPPETRPQFQIKKQANQVHVQAVTQTGAITEIPVFQHNTAALKLAVFGTDLHTHPARLLGTGTPVEPQIALPPSGTVTVYAMERGTQEPNISRPHLRVGNLGDVSIGPFTMDYYFTADPSRNPQAVVDAPQNIVMHTEHIVGHLWRVRIAVPQIPAHSSWPVNSTIQLRLHYGDWSQWTTADDYSVGNTLMPVETEMVVLRDAFNRIAWGEEPQLRNYTPSSHSTPEPLALELSFIDGGIHENNVIRPRISIRNEDTQILPQGYRIVLVLPAMGDEIPRLTQWYDPQFTGSAAKLNDHIRFVWSAQHSLHPGQQASLAEWGIHWPDWKMLDKSVLQSAQLLVLDENGNVVYGSWELPPDGPITPPDLVHQLQVAIEDAGLGESNVLRPKINLVHNQGTALESGFTVQLCFPWQEPMPQLIPWYAPVFVGELYKESSEMLCVQFESKERFFQGQELSLGDWGIHFADWRSFDKTTFSQATVTIKDENGRKVYP
jgi:hypothetical protein